LRDGIATIQRAAARSVDVRIRPLDDALAAMPPLARPIVTADGRSHTPRASIRDESAGALRPRARLRGFRLDPSFGTACTSQDPPQAPPYGVCRRWRGSDSHGRAVRATVRPTTATERPADMAADRALLLETARAPHGSTLIASRRCPMSRGRSVIGRTSGRAQRNAGRL
jgi:hypothetical protein